VAAHRNRLFVHQERQFRSRPLPFPEMNGRIDRIEPEVEGFQAADEIDRDARILSKELPKPWRQPTGTEQGQDSQVDGAAQRMGPQVQGGVRDAAKGFAYLTRIAVPGQRQPDRLPLPTEERDAQLFFESRNLATDGTLGQAKFIGCSRDAARTGSRLECG